MILYLLVFCTISMIANLLSTHLVFAKTRSIANSYSATVTTLILLRFNSATILLMVLLRQLLYRCCICKVKVLDCFWQPFSGRWELLRSAAYLLININLVRTVAGKYSESFFQFHSGNLLLHILNFIKGHGFFFITVNERYIIVFFISRSDRSVMFISNSFVSNSAFNYLFFV